MRALWSRTGPPIPCNRDSLASNSTGGLLGLTLVVHLMLIDSHCHLDRLKLDQCGGSVDAAIAAAKAEGVSRMLCVCISEDNKQAVLDIAQSHEGVFASVGVHPSDVTESVVTIETLKGWASAPKVVALGETGLDYYYTKDSREDQLESFSHHLAAAAQLQLPVIVHTRDAREDTLRCIRDHGSSESSGVLHCFTESWEMAKAAMDMNYFISISGIVTFKNAQELRDVVQKIPLERLLVETDSPYLAPVPYRGKSNQPKYVKSVAEFVAELKGVSYDALCEQTTDNFFRLFTRAV